MLTTELKSTVKNSEVHTKVLNPEGRESIILVHGMFGNLAQFYLTLAPYLAKEYRIIMYDIRCHGKTANTVDGFDLITLSDDLKQVMDIFELKKCHLLGFSYGALIVLKFAMRFKDRTDKIIAVEVPPRHVLPLKEKGNYTWDDFMGFTLTLTPSVRKNFLRSKRQVQKTYKMYEYIFNQTTFAKDLNNEPEFNTDDYMQIEVPIQLFFGNKSICLPELNRIKNWPKQKVVSIGNGDHGFFMHQSEQSAETIIEFLQDKLNYN